MRCPATRTVHRVDFGATAASRLTVAPVGRVPRVSRLLALAHRINQMIQSGELRDLADAARAIGVTRARMTQIMNLLLLAPELQEAILHLSLVSKGRHPISERALRPIVAEPEWNGQRALWSEVQGCQS